MGQNYSDVGFYVRRTTLLCQKLFQSQEKVEDQECFYFFEVVYFVIPSTRPSNDKTDVFSNDSAF